MKQWWLVIFVIMSANARASPAFAAAFPTALITLVCECGICPQVHINYSNHSITLIMGELKNGKIF